jgi:hypothetical protein
MRLVLHEWFILVNYLINKKKFINYFYIYHNFRRNYRFCRNDGNINDYYGFSKENDSIKDIYLI